MLAGRPHEAAGNGSPRWMAAGPRSRGCTEPGLQVGSPAALAMTCGFLVIGEPGWGSVPSLFRQSCRQGLVDGPSPQILGVLEQMPVGVHRFAEGGVVEPGLDDLRVEVGGDQGR